MESFNDFCITPVRLLGSDDWLSSPAPQHILFFLPNLSLNELLDCNLISTSRNEAWNCGDADFWFMSPISWNHEQSPGEAPTRKTTTFWDLLSLSSDDSGKFNENTLTKQNILKKSWRSCRFKWVKHLPSLSRTLLAYSYACYQEKRLFADKEKKQTLVDDFNLQSCPSSHKRQRSVGWHQVLS